MSTKTKCYCGKQATRSFDSKELCDIHAAYQHIKALAEATEKYADEAYKQALGEQSYYHKIRANGMRHAMTILASYGRL